jgi:hypothetical protein
MHCKTTLLPVVYRKQLEAVIFEWLHAPLAWLFQHRYPHLGESAC